MARFEVGGACPGNESDGFLVMIESKKKRKWISCVSVRAFCRVIIAWKVSGVDYCGIFGGI